VEAAVFPVVVHRAGALVEVAAEVGSLYFVTTACMSRNKLTKFAEFLAFPNTYTPWEEEKSTLEQWNPKHLPVTMELAAGTGAYTVALARTYPERFFLGVDIKGARMWTGARAALDAQLDNAFFLRSHIERLEENIPQASVEEIWITFADPFLAEGSAKKRLTSERFLGIYSRVLKQGGLLHLKTDSTPLFTYSLETIRSWRGEKGEHFLLENVLHDVYADPTSPEILTSIQTTYEKSHLAEGRTIQYLRARFVAL